MALKRVQCISVSSLVLILSLQALNIFVLMGGQPVITFSGDVQYSVMSLSLKAVIIYSAIGFVSHCVFCALQQPLSSLRCRHALEVYSEEGFLKIIYFWTVTLSF